MRRWVPAVLFALCLVGSSSAQAAYESATEAPTAGGYSASITGKSAATDVVFVLDNSGSMLNGFGGGDRWDAVSAATKTYVGQLSEGGLFARGGKVGLVLFNEGLAGELAPTAEVSAIDQKIDEGSASGGSCIACGLERAAELLTSIPGSSGHRRLIYVIADGANTHEPPSPAEAVAAANAAGAVRRVIGISSDAEEEGLESFDSDGSVAYVESQQALASAYSAETTTFPGATSITWTFHLTSDYVPSAPTATLGSAAISGSDVVWTIPSLGAETAKLSIQASKSASAKGCEPKGFLSGTSFSDAEGDPAPSVTPEAIADIACVRPRAAISLPKAPKKCWHRHSLKVKVSGIGISKTVVKLTGHKAKTFEGGSASGTIKVKAPPKGSYKVKVTVTLEDGRTETLTRSYRTCAPKPKR